MAKSISFRKFTDGGDMIAFSSLKFRTELDNAVQSNKERGIGCTKEQLYEVIAEKANVSVEAVKKWRSGHNGVGDLQTIKNIASALNINYENIIVRGNDMESKTIEQNFEPASSGEKELIVQMYGLFIDYVYWFCGSDWHCYADTVLENPSDEQERYVRNMYHFLDRVAISLSKETYLKLRMIITHLDQLYLVQPKLYPQIWKELNPILDTTIFNYLLESDAKTLEDFLTEPINEGGCDFEEDPQPLYHMLFEDLPEYKERYLENLKPENESPINNSYFNKLENSLPGERDFWLLVSTDTLISREVSFTLIKVMEHYFPQFFK